MASSELTDKGMLTSMMAYVVNENLGWKFEQIPHRGRNVYVAEVNDETFEQHKDAVIIEFASDQDAKGNFTRTSYCKLKNNIYETIATENNFPTLRAFIDKVRAWVGHSRNFELPTPPNPLVEHEISSASHDRPHDGLRDKVIKPQTDNERIFEALNRIIDMLGKLHAPSI